MTQRPGQLAPYGLESPRAAVPRTNRPADPRNRRLPIALNCLLMKAQLERGDLANAWSASLSQRLDEGNEVMRGTTRTPKALSPWVGFVQGAHPPASSRRWLSRVRLFLRTAPFRSFGSRTLDRNRRVAAAHHRRAPIWSAGDLPHLLIHLALHRDARAPSIRPDGSGRGSRHAR